MRILIAGAGDLGSRLALALRDQGHTPIALSRRGSDLPGVRSLALNLSEVRALESAVRDCDLIYFCAAPGARDLASYQAIYGDGIANLLYWRERQSLIFCSSTSVYAQDAGEWVDEDSEAVGSSALSAVLCASESALRDGDCSVRLGGIYGPTRNFAQRQAMAGVPAQCGLWTNRIHIEDASSVLAQLAGRGDLPRVLNLVDDEPCLQQDYYAWLRVRAGLPPIACQGAGAIHGKRVSNRRLRALGLDLSYANFRAGYG